KGTSALLRRTKTPFPWNDSTSPSDLSRDTASRTTVLETPKRSAISFSDGNLDSAGYSPPRMRRMSASATLSVRVPRGRSILRLGVALMARSSLARPDDVWLSYNLAASPSTAITVMHIVITGGAGFLGSRLARELLKR